MDTKAVLVIELVEFLEDLGLDRATHQVVVADNPNDANPVTVVDFDIVDGRLVLYTN